MQPISNLPRPLKGGEVLEGSTDYAYHSAGPVVDVRIPLIGQGQDG
jgi:hypothetical protein